jgi:hypothetical protein
VLERGILDSGPWAAQSFRVWFTLGVFYGNTLPNHPGVSVSSRCTYHAPQEQARVREWLTGNMDFRLSEVNRNGPLRTHNRRFPFLSWSIVVDSVLWNGHIVHLTLQILDIVHSVVLCLSVRNNSKTFPWLYRLHIPSLRTVRDERTSAGLSLEPRSTGGAPFKSAHHPIPLICPSDAKSGVTAQDEGQAPEAKESQNTNVSAHSNPYQGRKPSVGLDLLCMRDACYFPTADGCEDGRWSVITCGRQHRQTKGS